MNRARLLADYGTVQRSKRDANLDVEGYVRLRTVGNRDPLEPSSIVDDKPAAIGCECVMRRKVTPRRALKLVMLLEPCKPAIRARLEVENTKPHVGPVSRCIDKEPAVR